MPIKPTIERHYGLDWLRIGAFAVLIVYHIGMYFGPYHWVIKAPVHYDWLAYPLSLVMPWRLVLLFAVSGYATAAMLGKSASIMQFFRERSKRLLVPLLFGIAVIVPPQDWVRMQLQNGTPPDISPLLPNAEFAFSNFWGLPLPNWEHLWFLGYLWLYTALLMAVLALVPHARTQLQAFAAWLSIGHRLLLVPIAVMALVRLAIMYLHMDNAQEYTDLVGDAHYIPAFIFGLLLAWQPGLWAALRRVWRGAATLALMCAIYLCSTIMITGTNADLPRDVMIVQTIADSAFAWSMIPVLLALADRLLNHDHRWRGPLAQAVFPAYIVHQTLIVLVGWQLHLHPMPGLPAFAVMLAIVLAGCVFAYFLARRYALIGMVLGLPHGKAPQRLAAQAV